MGTVPQFIPVGELAEGYNKADSNALPLTADLAGKNLTLYFDNGSVIEHRFVDANTLVWTITSGDNAGDQAEESYTASNPRPDIYLIDYVKSRERSMTVSVVLDFRQNIFTAVLAEMPTRKEAEKPFLERIAAGQELTGVSAAFLHGSINSPCTGATPRHEQTTELIGKRIEYTYAPDEKYEHVYMNQNFYTWHCLRGPEKGLTDAERCAYYKIADQLYLFVWREKIIPTLGLILVDLQALQTSGKIVGYHGNDFGRLINFRVGAKARIISVI
jgi:hypothetical protein